MDKVELSGLLFTFGIARALLAIRQRASFALLVTLIGIVGTSALTVSTLNSARLIAVTPLAVLLVALGLRETVDTIIPLRRWLGRGLLGIVTGGIVSAGAYLFFFEYANRSNYDYPGGEIATELGYLMRRSPAGTRFVFFAEPHMSCTTHASLRFIAPAQQCLDMPPDGSGRPRPALRPTDLLVALPDRRAEAEQLVAGRADLQAQNISRIKGTSTLFTIWQPVDGPVLGRNVRGRVASAASGSDSSGRP